MTRVDRLRCRWFAAGALLGLCVAGAAAAGWMAAGPRSGTTVVHRLGPGTCSDIPPNPSEWPKLLGPAL
jgi:hypothetical protein